MGSAHHRLAIDPEVAAALAATPPLPAIDLSVVGDIREPSSDWNDGDLPSRGLVRDDEELARPDGTSLAVSVLRPLDHRPAGPAIYFVHGGGLIMGDRFRDLSAVLAWLGDPRETGAVIVTVDYRLAPEHRHLEPHEDVVAGARWMSDEAARLGIDQSRILAIGSSAGGGLLAGASLRLRDEGDPRFAGQMLLAPMLDDRGRTASSSQIHGYGVWDDVSNHTGWAALLGDSKGGANVSAYEAPARAADMSRLPPTYVDVGAVDVFRDESVEFTQRIWTAGGDAELHVWPGAVHAFDAIAPHARVSEAAHHARRSWLARAIRRMD